LTSGRWRALTDWAERSYQLSERRACKALRTPRSTIRYASRRASQAPLCGRIREIAEVRISYGYRRIHVLLRREGWRVNHKRTYRLYREEGLGLRRKRPKRRRSAVAREARVMATRPNQRWSMDFMSDALANGQKLRVLTVIDTYTRECIALEAATSFRGQDVAAVLTRVGTERDLPTTISVDNGTEFTSKAFDQWAYDNRVKLDFSRPGKPTDNAMIEAFNARVRRECLSEHYFSTLAEARIVLQVYRSEFNFHRPHSSLRGLTPAQFRAGLDDQSDRRQPSIRVA
jgi:putative transposase